MKDSKEKIKFGDLSWGLKIIVCYGWLHLVVFAGSFLAAIIYILLAW